MSVYMSVVCDSWLHQVCDKIKAFWQCWIWLKELVFSYIWFGNQTWLVPSDISQLKFGSICQILCLASEALIQARHSRWLTALTNLVCREIAVKLQLLLSHLKVSLWIVNWSLFLWPSLWLHGVKMTAGLISRRCQGFRGHFRWPISAHIHLVYKCPVEFRGHFSFYIHCINVTMRRKT